MGYLPEGLRNYLLRLGWSHGDQELFSDAEAIAAFNLGGLNKAPARMDIDKLNHINAHHISLADDARLVELVLPFLDALEARIEDTDITRQRLLAAMTVLKTRAATLEELAAQSYFLLRPRPFQLTDKAAKPLDDNESRERLYRLFTHLGDVKSWTEAALSDALKAFAEIEQVGFGKIGQPLRAALTGGAPAPDLALVMTFIGRDETLDRIKDQMTPVAPA